MGPVSNLQTFDTSPQEFQEKYLDENESATKRGLKRALVEAPRRWTALCFMGVWRLSACVQCECGEWGGGGGGPGGLMHLGAEGGGPSQPFSSYIGTYTVRNASCRGGRL